MRYTAFHPMRRSELQQQVNKIGEAFDDIVAHMSLMIVHVAECRAQIAALRAQLSPPRRHRTPRSSSSEERITPPPSIRTNH